MKRRISFLISILIIFSLAIPVFANRDYNLKINEDYYNNKEILDLDGIIYLPVRDVLERLNYIVNWDHDTRTVEARKYNDLLEFSINNNVIISNGESYTLNGKNILKEEYAYSPVEFFGKYVDAIGSYNEKNNEFSFRNIKDNRFDENFNNDISNKIDEYIQKNVDNRNFHGSVLVAKEGEVLLNKGYSFANIEHGIDNKMQTRFSIGSITKQFTSVAILKLYEEGKLNLDDSINKYLPEVINSKNITIHNLLSHGSGLINFTDELEYYSLKGDSDHYEEIIELINSKGVNFEPGEMFEYSNTNYLLLSKIVEKVTNTSFEEYLRENILKPAGMQDSGLNYGINKISKDATGYVGFLDVEVMDDELLQRTASGAGSMYSTVEDLYRWTIAIKENKIINKNTTKLLLEKQNNMGNEDLNYGYGIMILETDDGLVYLHDGQTFGFSSILVNYPKEDITIIVLVNNRLYDVSSIQENIKNIIDGKDVNFPKEIIEVELEENIINKFTGKYKLDDNIILEITNEEGKIKGQLTGQGVFDTIYLGNNTFIVRQADAVMEFIFNNDQVEKIIFKQLGISLELPKIKDLSIEKNMLENQKIDIDNLIGIYKTSDNIEIEISSKENHLYAQFPGQDKVEIYNKENNEYVYKIVDAKIKFVEVDKEETIKLILEQGPIILEALKV